MRKLKTLYRPVGLTELRLIIESGCKAFPPRLEWQPIFYPVLNFDYASQIANNWNTQDAFSDYCGFVTEFDLPISYLEEFEIKNVGGFMHNELWVPTGELLEFNSQIRGKIRISRGYFGNQFNKPKEPLLNLFIQKFIDKGK